MTYRLLFEQSGTFKNVLKSLGFEAYDYDIANDFGETDYKIDLFKEIELASYGCNTIFDSFAEGDIVLAFFPCVRFSGQFLFIQRLEAPQFNHFGIYEKLIKSIDLNNEVARYFALLNWLCVICLRKSLKLVIENPYNPQHFLKERWFLKPDVIINDRTRFGDYFVKPTQFYFVGWKPYDNALFEPILYMKKDKDVEQCNTVERSMMSSQFASWFLRSFVLAPDSYEIRSDNEANN